MIVGQYYMTQINNQLGEINSELDKIATFQDKEYQSRIYALVAAVQKCSHFQYEIMEDEEQRRLPAFPIFPLCSREYDFHHSILSHCTPEPRFLFHSDP